MAASPVAKIVVPLMGSSRDATALATAFAAAQPFGAHVEAVHVRPTPDSVVPFFPEGISAETLEDIIETAIEASDMASKNAKQAWKDSLSPAGALETEGPQKLKNVTSSYRELSGEFAPKLCEAAKLADLVVLPALMPEERPELTAALNAVLSRAGRPVLISAHVPPKSLFRKIAIGWDGSFTAARALNAAMPYLGQTEDVDVIGVNGTGVTKDMTEELKSYLTVHQLPSSFRSIEAGGREIGEALLAAASGGMADMLVMGAYGHSRLRESLFGGVTAHVVSHPRLPVFLAH